MAHNTVIKVTNLSKTFKNIIAVDDVSLSIHEGDVYGVLGPNGAGKTTTISMMLSLVHPTRGSIEILGARVTPDENEILKNVGSLVGDRPSYFPYFTGRQNVSYVASMSGASDARVDEVIKFMGIADAANRMPDTYSTGMKQRLGIALAIVHKPKLLILDEPSNGMDPQGMKEIRDLILDLKAQGITIVLCSHMLHEVEQVCNRVAVFNRGKIVAEGGIDDLRGKSMSVCVETKKLEETKKLLESLPKASIKKVSSSLLEVRNISSEEVMEKLVRASLTPSEVYTQNDSLEDLFLKLIEKG